MRAPLGTRIEEMPVFIDQVEAHIRKLIPADELVGIVDIVGGPYSPYNTLYNNNGTFDSSDTEILVTLQPVLRKTAEHIRTLRRELPQKFPGNEFFFQPADMVSQTLNFGLSAPIDIQIQGNKTDENLAVATELINQVRQVPGAVDVTLHQRFNRRAISLEMDRAALAQTGLVARDVAQNVMVSMSSSFQTAPTLLAHTRTTGTVYNVAVQVPQQQIDSLGAMLSLPVNAPNSAQNGTGQPRDSQVLGSLVQVKPTSLQGNVSHYNIANVLDIHVGVEGRDLARHLRRHRAPDRRLVRDKAAARLRDHRARPGRHAEHGLQRALLGPGGGGGAGLPAAGRSLSVVAGPGHHPQRPARCAGWHRLDGYLSGTPLSVPALTGAIMTVGVATANSILVVSFARQRLADGVPALSAALQAGSTRLRPVLMTALAMVIGMVPMALGLGEGGEQNAPLGRAVHRGSDGGHAVDAVVRAVGLRRHPRLVARRAGLLVLLCLPSPSTPNPSRSHECTAQPRRGPGR